MKHLRCLISDLREWVNTRSETVQFSCMGTDWAPGRTKSKIFNMKNTRPCPFMCLLRFTGSTGFTVVCAQRKRSCRDHLRFSTKLHLQDMPISELGSYIFHVLRLQLNEKADILRNFFFVRRLCNLPGLYSWLCLIMGRTIIALCEFLSCSSGYCLVYTQPQNLTTFTGVHFKYNHLQLGHRNT